MQEQDRRAVESMCSWGLDLEAIKKSFPAFPPEEIEEVYSSVAGARNDSDGGSGLSINCS